MKLNIIIFFLIVANINLFASFSKEGNIVKDSKTNLMWQDNSDVKNNKQDWSSALEYCRNLTLDSYSNWRLPNIRELRSITYKAKFNPAIHYVFQNIASSYYWSASTYAGDASLAWVVDFEYGYSGFVYKSGSLYVGCVRPE